MGSGVVKQHVCWWAGLYLHLASCLVRGILVLVPTGWWGLEVDPNANKLGRGVQNGTCQRQYPHGRKNTPKVTIASVCVPRMSSSCFLPLWEASWDQQVDARARMCSSRIWLFVTPCSVARQAPLSLGFSRQEYWSGLTFPSLGDLPDPGIKPGSLASPALAGEVVDSLPLRHLGSPMVIWPRFLSNYCFCARSQSCEIWCVLFKSRSSISHSPMDCPK